MLGRQGWVAIAARRHLRSVRTLVWGALLAALSLMLAFTPLFDVLGFEFAFAMGIAAAIASADLGAAAVRRLRAAPCRPIDRTLSPGHLVAETWGRATLVHLTLLAAPLAIISANALRVQNCDWLFGFECYFMLTALSAAGGTAIGVACGFAAGDRKKLSTVLPFLVAAAAIVWSLWRFYQTPPVYSYNLFAGYFPGNLYDEQVALGRPVYWARLLHAVGLFALLSLVARFLDVKTASVTRGPRRPDGPRRRLTLASVGGGAAALGLWLASAALGFDFDAGDLKEELTGHHETEHFVIHYAPGGEISRDIELIAEDHEFRLAQVTRSLGVAPPEEKIVSYYFSDPNHKHRLMGARRVYMAKPWRGEIYLNHQAFPHPILKHEIVHVVAGEFGDPLFGVSARSVLGIPLLFNVGLIEGIAVAVDWPDHFTRALTPHQSVKALLELGQAPPLGSLLGTQFLSFSSARSYTVAGSFVRYLLDHHGGAEPLRRVYRSGGDFPAAYGMSAGALVASWRQMIDAVELPEGAAEIVRERFRRPSIFRRHCPHAIARMRARAIELAARGRHGDALEKAREVCDAAPGEPRYRLDLAELYLRAGDAEKARALYEELAANEEEISSSLRARALLSLTDMAARAGEWQDVEEILDRAAALPVEDDLARNIVTRRWVALADGAGTAELRAYFWGGDADKTSSGALLGRAALALAADPSSGLAHYLVGRQLRGRGAPDGATRALSRALDHGLPHPLLTRECARLLAEAAYLAGDLEAVERAAEILSDPEQPEVMRLLGADWLERVYWKRHGRLPPRPDPV